jgi:hypothetical protein
MNTGAAEANRLENPVPGFHHFRKTDRPAAPVRIVSSSLRFLQIDSCQIHSGALSMDLDGRLREPILNKQMLDFVSMITLEQYQAILRGSATSAVSLEFSAQVSEVDTFRIDSLDNRGRLSPFPSLKADLHKLLLHANGSADTQIFRKPTSGANFRHNWVQLLLFGDADIASDSI